MSFDSLYDQGFVRVAAVTLPVHLADPAANAIEIIAAAQACHDDSVAVAVFPELSVSGYSLDDLLLQADLLESVAAAIESIMRETVDLFPVLVIGAPLALNGALYNCAVIIHRGQILGITPKSYLPSYREFYEKRHFSTLPDGAIRSVEWRRGLVSGGPIPFGAVQVRATDLPGFQLAAEVCEDLWVPISPSSISALQGATILANLSASPITVGRARQRQELVKSHSAVTNAAYIYTAAGYGESSNDLSWDGQSLIFEGGECLARSDRFGTTLSITTADVDLQRLAHERLQQNSFHDNGSRLMVQDLPVTIVDIELTPPTNDVWLRREVARFPFVPDEPDRLDSDCYEAFNIQVSALARRIQSIGSPKLIIGVSGGLDSTQALLVAVRALDRLQRPRADVLAYTMPGFGTTPRTRQNAETLCSLLGVTFTELDIRPAAEQMLSDMKHPYSAGMALYDVAFENVQAGLRTDYLFRLANQLGGIVVGTGDLSELALGWCTYGVGDQMSHYGVNAGLPKTMIQHLIRWVAASENFQAGLGDVLDSILDTEISPELVPTDSADTPQSTQAVIGPYELQDFTLYYLLHYGFGPRRIAFLAAKAWEGKYSGKEILQWLQVFHQRFFTNQFKRTAIPNGPKILSGGALSPRGDWRMPSDALSTVWLKQIQELQELTAK